MALTERWLRESVEKGGTLCFHLDASDTSRFVLGAVRNVSAECIFLCLADRAGRFDGFLAVRREGIVRVSMGGPYHRAVEEAIGKDALPEFPIDVSTEIEPLLTHLRRNRRSVCLHDRYGSVTKGFIEDFDDEDLAVSVYTSALHFDGHEILRLDDVEQLEFGGPDQQLPENLILSSRSPGDGPGEG